MRVFHQTLGAICLTAIILFVFAPILFLCIASITSDNYLSSGIPSFTYGFSHFVGRDGFIERIDNILIDTEIHRALFQSLLTSIGCGLSIASTSWIAGYIFTRSVNRWVRISLPIALCTYLFPPVSLAIGISDSSLFSNWVPIKMQIFIGHYLYLFPLAYVMSIGFWLQKPDFLDRMAVSDGVGFFSRIRAHMGGKETSQFFVIWLLVFMVSWGDVIFSRVLASMDSSDQLLTDLVFQRLYADQLNEPFGSLAVFALIVIFIAAIFSNMLAFILDYEDRMD